MHLSKNDIRHNCGNSALERGERYFRQKRVLRTVWHPEDNWLEAKVLGTAIYEQSIYLQPRKGHIDISGDCSCPVCFNCKHVVAALLALMSQMSVTPAAKNRPAASPLALWQQGLSQASATTQPPSPESQSREQLVYVLNHRPERGHSKLEVDILRTRRLKSGGFGKASPYHLGSYRYYGGYYASTPAYASQADVLILHRLQSWMDNPTRQTRKPYLDGEEGSLLLKQLLQTGRCFWQDYMRPPLRLGSPRTMKFFWQADEKGQSRLQMQPEDSPEDWVLCPTEPPWYIDSTHYSCGLLDFADNHPISGAMLDQLQRLPPVPEADLPQLARLLLDVMPPNSLPLPVELPVRDILDVKPTPVLHLWGDVAKGTPTTLGLFGRVSFDYEGVRIPPMSVLEKPFSLHQHGTYEYRIQHQPEAETRALADLVALGFEPVNTQPSERQLDVTFVQESALLPIQEWQSFLSTGISLLQEQGWQVERDASFRLDILEPTQWRSEIDDSSGERWFDMSLSLTVADQQVQLLPLLVSLLEQFGPTADPLAMLDQMETVLVTLQPGVWLRLPSRQLRPIVQILLELFDGLSLGAGGQLRLPQAHATSLLELEQALAQQGAVLAWQGGGKIRELAQKLADFDGIQAVPTPANLQATLRAYQQTGLNWLQFLREYKFGGILADDMGLGKTVQALAHLLVEKNAGRLEQPALVIAPTSVLSNWRREAERFAPDLKVLLLHGSQRHQEMAKIKHSDLVITSYPLLVRDAKTLQKQTFHSIILDEAQYIKNAKAKTTLLANKLKAQHTLCLTGTPIENNLGELWSLFNFLMPGFLNDLSRFNQIFRNPIEKTGDGTRQHELNRRIKPFLLRRTKQEVAKELPPKTEILQTVSFGKEQAMLYESIRIAMEEKVRALLASQGLARSHIQILEALLKLRQVCCHPQLLKLPAAQEVQESVKLQLLSEMLPELLAEGRKVLIFSQFVQMLGLLEAQLKTMRIAYTKLTGQTRKRDEAIMTFQNGDVAVFLISLKAGGVGLNLTAADTVIIYDPWWNPAAEQQAIDRAYRIGQDKPVFVYKFIVEQSLEEKILHLQQRKQALADAVYAGGASDKQALTAEELLDLLQPMALADT